MPTISTETQKNIGSMVGMDFNELVNLDFDDEIEFVTKKVGKKPIFSKKTDGRKFGRGNPLLSRKMIKTIEDVNEGLKRIKK